MPANLAGYIVASALARDVKDPDERRRLSLIGGLMPSPVIGAVIVKGLIDRTEDDLDKRDEKIRAIDDGLAAADRALEEAQERRDALARDRERAVEEREEAARDADRAEQERLAAPEVREAERARAEGTHDSGS